MDKESAQGGGDDECIFIHMTHKICQLNATHTNVEISSLTVVVPWWRETHPVGMHNKAKVNLMTKFMCIVWCDGR